MLIRKLTGEICLGCFVLPLESKLIQSPRKNAFQVHVSEHNYLHKKFLLSLYLVKLGSGYAYVLPVVNKRRAAAFTDMPIDCS